MLDVEVELMVSVDVAPGHPFSVVGEV